MAQGITISLKAPKFAILVARARGLSERGVHEAIASALTFTAKDYAEYKRGRTDKDVVVPHGFTKLYANFDGADRKAASSDLLARAYVRPKQARYLEYVEYGGEKKYQKGHGGPVWIKEDYKDKFGGGWGQNGFERKWLSKTAGKMANAKRGKGGGYAAGTKLYRQFTLPDRLGKWGGDVTGIWELTKLAKGSRDSGRRKAPHFGPNLKRGWKTFLIVAFLKKGQYDNPRLNFGRDGLRFGQAKLPKLAQRLLDAKLAKLATR